MTEVFNLATGETLHYTLCPRRGVIAAYAKYTAHDGNTWDYDVPTKYNSLVVSGERTVACGDWCALKRVRGGR